MVIENNNKEKVDDLQVGFTIEEMANRVEGLLKSIGLVQNFAPIVYVVGHGATSVNNTHYAGYDCGACCGRPSSVNAKVASYAANHAGVRAILKERGITIPEETQFLPALHDTTRDEIAFYDEETLSENNKALHQQNVITFTKALDNNAKERSSIEEVQIIKELVKNLKDDFAILTPYKNQVKLLKEVLGRSYFENIMTIHKSQGSEWNTVIFSVVDDSLFGKRKMFFTDSLNENFKSLNLINTVVSRTKKRLIIVANEEFWINQKNTQLIGNMISISKSY